MGKIIAFQGEMGAFSHEACRALYPDCTPMPCVTFGEALQAVSSGAAELAVMPIENSLYGRVADLHHLLPSSDLYIIGETFLPIHLNLLALPGASLDNIREAQSHIVALGQCRDFLIRHDIRSIGSNDTAGSARQVAELADMHRAAIASSLAGEIYGLKTLASHIEDADHNTTRFLIMSRESRHYSVGEENLVTSFVFQVRNVPAALYKALGGFATNNINITKLESYMLNGSFNATQFYAEFDGHPEEALVKFALEELDFFTSRVKILGTYPMHSYRREAHKKADID